MEQANKGTGCFSLSRGIWKDERTFIACGFGAGSLPIMPGTYGSLVAVLLYYIIIDYGWPAYIISIVVVTIVAVYLCGYVMTRYRLVDPGEACIDEFPGMMITLIGISPSDWHWVALGFFLFRVFDVLKPWPIGWIDRHMKTAWGMVLDDIAAGIAAGLVLQLAYRWWG